MRHEDRQQNLQRLSASLFPPIFVAMYLTDAEPLTVRVMSQRAKRFVRSNSYEGSAEGG